MVAGNYDATVDYGTLLGSGIKLVVDTATRIDPANRTVGAGLRPCARLRLRHLRGRQHRRRTGISPGAAEFAYPIAELEQAQRLRAALDDMDPDAR